MKKFTHSCLTLVLWAGLTSAAQCADLVVIVNNANAQSADLALVTMTTRSAH